MEFTFNEKGCIVPDGLHMIDLEMFESVFVFNQKRKDIQSFVKYMMK